MKKLIVAVLVVLLASSCVSNKKFNSMKAEALRLEGELAASRNRLDDMTGQNEKLAAEKARLVADTVRLSGELNDYRRRYKQLLDDGSAESARMLRELEDKEMALSDRSRRVAELEGMLRSREEAIDAIRRKVTDALTGFEGKGLSISIRNGNVYVSMDDKLLFRSGSFEIDPNGARAVRDLSEVLAQNPDINVMVEGHTRRRTLPLERAAEGQPRPERQTGDDRRTPAAGEQADRAEPHHSRRAGRIASGRSGQDVRGPREEPTYRNYSDAEARRADATDEKRRVARPDASRRDGAVAKTDTACRAPDGRNIIRTTTQAMPIYKRILLKLSGESLMGTQKYGLSTEVLGSYAEQIAAIAAEGVQIGIVIGGGNIFRGLTGVGRGFDRVKGDQMGMLATVINSLALQGALESAGAKAQVLTSIRMEPVGELYSKAKALELMEEGRIVIVAGGTGNPYFTTDTASALRGVEIEAEVLLKGTRVDGIYTADPEKDPTAEKFSQITFDEVYRRQLKVMDLTAFTMCKQNDLPIVVFDMDTPGNLRKVIDGEQIGTVVRN